MTRRVLQPGRRDGLVRDDARSWRQEVSASGALAERHGSTRTRTVAEPGQVARIVHVPGELLSRRLLGRGPWGGRSGDAVAFLGDDDVLLTVGVDTLHHGIPDSDPAAQRATSGLPDVSLALHHPLEPASADEVRRVAAARDAVAVGPAEKALRRRVLVHRLLALWLLAALVLRAVVGPSPDDPHPWLDLLVVAPLLAWAVDGLVLARRFVGGHDTNAALPATVVRNHAAPDRWAWVRESELRIDAEVVVLRQHAREAWVPGPAHGGVVRCEVSPDAVWFLDRHGVPLMVVPADLWARDDARSLRAACDAARIEVGRRREHDLPPYVQADYAPEVYKNRGALLYLISMRDRGMLVPGSTFIVPTAAVVAAAGALVPALRADVDGPGLVVAVVLGAAALLAAALSGATALLLRRWTARQMTTREDGDGR